MIQSFLKTAVRSLVEHRKNYIRLSGVSYDTLHYSTLAFIPPDTVLELFRQDYRAMQAAMIYGTSPDFDTMISQLKLLTGRFRLIEEDHKLEHVIKDAENSIDQSKTFGSEGAIYSTPVAYFSDPYKPARPANKSIAYKVKFIWRTNKWVFEDIKINQS